MSGNTQLDAQLLHRSVNCVEQIDAPSLPPGPHSTSVRAEHVFPSGQASPTRFA